ncbi:MAG TPA: hypothetical protein DDW92_03435 [Candidatus Veblenbacteria bacterium]|uniref:Prepilin-type N-terminal cleavage/methylation domain-containing protein n=2 Tax=Candidatus Vebleniibacteriota TaxID=1817921 RepID=A0A1G2Q4S0_9BACT|nr:MAG: putative membrane protein [Parcubacteria group bacterium GW2011_GWA2_42_80]KKS93238.1 MAG: putative membrane protein [Parcubacteria group bacterium GW2011_GWE2_43_12]OHA55595.1 MAG: hypothetical protein A2226_03535 [Candidatus Veblenbacteria bacterium RIFOXYA2_FULL_43_9]OHA56479.1 MAG: hypothetical protein A2441_01685 [Candidatus Veblenbacteria bacterium RIFOXYC2_FULL_42_11]HBH17287.1 hypothetical protein [Candidatus Veblenbacteria bacterium]
MKLTRGFSVLEVMVSILIGLLLLMATYSVFILSQRTEKPIANRAEITQNQRAILDRVTRELRQANDFVTTLPDDEILFEDGHGVISNDPVQYIKYHLSGSDLYREILYYYFAADPLTHVLHDELDQFGNPPLVQSVEDKIIGEYINSLTFSGNGTITISLEFIKNGQTLIITTDVSPRNLN